MSETKNKRHLKKPMKMKLKKPKLKKFNWKNFLSYFITFCVIVGIIGVAAGSALMFSMASKAPEVNIEDFSNKESSQIFDMNGDLIDEVGYQIRTNVTYDQLPNSLIDALVAVEDSRFFEHPGFDITRFVKAMIENLKSLSFSQGGSTLTMQLIDNTYFMNEELGIVTPNNIARKVQEIFMALRIDSQTTKKNIVELYLNKMNFGGSGNIRGVQQASLYYFGKDVSELTLSESAILAGVINAPGAYDPHKNLDLATERRNIVLNLMLRHGYITQLEADLAKSINVEDVLVDHTNNASDGIGNPNQAYIDAVIKEATELTGLDPTVVSMKIYTCMDPDVQKTMDDIQAGNVVEFPDEKMEVGGISMNNQTGEIVAVLGGRNYASGGSLLLNHATDQYNQPGSSVKTLLSYPLAFEYLGWSTSHTVIDQPMVYAGTSHIIQNYNKKYNGQMTLKDAVGTSMNTPALTTLQAVMDSQKNGKSMVVEYMQNIGFSKVTMENFDLGYGIGGSSFLTNAVELAGAQAAIINYGSYIQPHTITKIEFNDGKAPVEPVYNKNQVISEEAAFLTTELLKSNTSSSYSNYMQIIQRGRNYPIFAKTGTTDWGNDGVKYGIPKGNARDKWMIASSSIYTTSLWVGYEKAYEDYYWTSSKSKLNIPGNITKVILDSLHENESPPKLEQPKGVVGITHIIGTYPYVATFEGSDAYNISGKIKKENAIVVDPLVQPIENLASFTSTLNSAGKLVMNWGAYPDPTKLVIAPEEWDISQELAGRWIEAYGKRIFDWTWIYGPIKYRADIYVNDQLLQTVTSDTEASELDIQLKPGNVVKACGYYQYELMGTKSNEQCVEFEPVEDKDVTITFPSQMLNQQQIQDWAKENNIPNITFEVIETEVADLVGKNTIFVEGTETPVNNTNTIYKTSQLADLKLIVQIYTLKATPTPEPSVSPEPSVPPVTPVPSVSPTPSTSPTA